MANARSVNTFYVDTSSVSTTSSSFISEKNLKLIGVVYHVATASDTILIYDKDPSTNAAGVPKFTLSSSLVNHTQQIRLESTPIPFSNGVWVTVAAGAKATLIFAAQGSGS